MKNRLQLSVSLSTKKSLGAAQVFVHEFTCQNFDQAGLGGWIPDLLQ